MLGARSILGSGVVLIGIGLFYHQLLMRTARAA